MMNNVQNRDGSLQSICLVFHALTLSDLLKGLPANFEDIKIVNVYAAPGVEGDDWKAHLNDQDQAWIITPLHYSGGGSKFIRKASGGGTWDARTRLLKKHGDAYWYERKYNLVQITNKQQATNEQTGNRKYTMIEYLPGDDKSDHALCRIIVDKNYAHDRQPSSSRQPKNMITTPIQEIDHTDANNGDKGGNFENATGYDNLPVVEVDQGKVRECRQNFSDEDILKVFSRSEYEKRRAQRQIAEAGVSHPKKRSHWTDTNTLEADTSTQWQEQAKVELEMFESNSYARKPYSYNLSDLLEENWDWSDHQMVEQTAHVKEPTKLTHNFNANSTHPTDNWNYLPFYNQPRTSNYATTEGWLDHQLDEPNADVQEPNKLSHNFNANSTEPNDNWNFLPFYNQPSTINYATTEDRLDHQMLVVEPKNLSHNFNMNSTKPTDNWNYLPIYNQPSTSTCASIEGRLDHQMVESNADAQEPKKLSHNFNAHSTEPKDNWNYLPFYNQPSTSNYATTEVRLDQQMVLLNADVQELNKFSHNFNANSRDPSDNWNYLPIYNQPSTNNYTFIEGRLDHQMVELNADVQEPKKLSHNFNANSTEPKDNWNYLPFYNQPSTSNYATTEGRLGHQMVEPNADVRWIMTENIDVDNLLVDIQKFIDSPVDLDLDLIMSPGHY